MSLNNTCGKDRVPHPPDSLNYDLQNHSVFATLSRVPVFTSHELLEEFAVPSRVGPLGYAQPEKPIPVVLA